MSKIIRCVTILVVCAIVAIDAEDRLMKANKSALSALLLAHESDRNRWVVGT